MTNTTIHLAVDRIPGKRFNRIIVEMNGKVVSIVRTYRDGSRRISLRNYPCSCGKKLNLRQKDLIIRSGETFFWCHTQF